MGSDRTRAAGLAIAYGVLIVVSTVVMAWFVIDLAGTAKIEVGLRSATVCKAAQCIEFVIPSRGTNFFGIFSTISMWGSLALLLVVAYQAYQIYAGGIALESVTNTGMLASVLLVLTGVLAGFVFGTDMNTGTVAAGGLEVSVKVTRTLAPILYIVAHLAGIASLYFASRDRSDELPAREPHPYMPPAVARQRELAAAGDPRIKKVSEPIVPLAAVGPLAPSTHPPSERTRRASEAPFNLRKKLNYVVLSGEVTPAGIDAHREDGSSPLVMWRDVVGMVVRRLPDSLDGATFLDVVSVRGSTLRILPWTRLTGVAVTGETEERIRSLVAYVQREAPQSRCDSATKLFLGGEPAAQLKDAAMLATHDERLA